MPLATPALSPRSRFRLVWSPSRSNSIRQRFRASGISFNLLRQKDGSRVKQQYVAVNDGALVERSEMTKGYEFAKGQYVMFSAEELKALEDTTTHTIDITQFVPLESVDPVYFDGTYYLAPDKGGAKPYSLLAIALKKAKQCAVGRWISRGKEHIVILRPMDDGLAMHQLHFKAEVRSIKDLGVEAAPVSEAELKLANQLIEQLAAKRFDPMNTLTSIAPGWRLRSSARWRARKCPSRKPPSVERRFQRGRLDGSAQGELECSRVTRTGERRSARRPRRRRFREKPPLPRKSSRR